MNKIIDTLGHYALTLIVLIYIIYEELVWERFALPIVRYITSLKLLQKFEVFLQSADRIVVLLFFSFLFLITELQGIYAGILLLEGKIVTSIFVYAGKIPIAAFTFWLFRVTKNKLMTFEWFKTSHDFVMSMIERVKQMDIYKDIKRKAAHIRSYVKQRYLTGDNSSKEKLLAIYSKLKMRLKEKLKV